MSGVRKQVCNPTLRTNKNYHVNLLKLSFEKEKVTQFVILTKGCNSIMYVCMSCITWENQVHFAHFLLLLFPKCGEEIVTQKFKW